MDWSELFRIILDATWWSSAEGISSVLAIVVTFLGGVTTIVVKAINDTRRRNGENTCCLTGRKLKPKKKNVKSKSKT